MAWKLNVHKQELSKKNDFTSLDMDSNLGEVKVMRKYIQKRKECT
jgi:hypothetical protein